MFKYGCLIALALLFSCKEKENTSNTTEQETASIAYTEKFRPQFHFSPPEKWMNDPNGLVFHEGVYHLFYQYYPDDIVWGPMHWGHAVSKDMIRWENKPIALYPDELGLIFSGSAVVDRNNTSGFGEEGKVPLVAIYTYHLMEGEKAGRNDFQTQGIAYSLDNGDSWTKYEGNPVIGNDGIKDFRDPKVFWHEPSQNWIMALVAGDHVKFYESDNLKEWELTSEFGKDKGAHGGVWECPDLFKLPVTGNEEEKWVLLVSMNPGAPNGGSGTQYFVGEFDGTSFTTDQEDAKWIDYGMDNYAGVTYNNTPNGERIFIGWMSNWNYARNTPTEVWRSSMTLPRNISLHKKGGEYNLQSLPLEQFSSLQKMQKQMDSIVLNETYTLEADTFNNTDISFTANLNEPLEVSYSNASGEKVSFTINPEEHKLLLDRTQSGIVDFEESFGQRVQEQPFTLEDREVDIRLIMDASSLEIFIEEGSYIFTNQLFPKEEYTTFEIKAGDAGGVVRQFTYHKITSIWN
ncbi:glycoside hydrolase family 32 protein [Aureisphaera galaxeae]|uniref:glycoside hydrolase family 32 protein n=1 Tax=Aureisphaera galaxeae TaxID=1538023 RepID=UPI002350AE79|nr:glycoside hydrolase family 32 protein [Aureisphaera galaxeae]MDC8003006.1 glycoside hydrolase family 32 protein [Aureisphaera galaxeae]